MPTITPDQFSDLGSSQIAGGAGGVGTSLLATDTSLLLTAGTGAKYPASGPFYLTLGALTPTPEVVKVGSRASDTLSGLVRGLDGTTAQTWLVGTTVDEAWTASNANNLWSSLLAVNTALGQLAINVKDPTYGATGNGVTDDTAAIQAAINAANAAGGGLVFFPAGTYITRTLTMFGNVHLYGAGWSATTLKLKSATNADLIDFGSANAALINLSAAFGTGTQAAPHDWSIRDLTLDGNKAGQTSGPSYPLRAYAFGYLIQNVIVQNGFSGGVLCDWNGGTGSGTPNQMEARWLNVKVHDNSSIGYETGGPHDSQFVNFEVFGSGTHDIHLAPNASACIFTQAHAYTPGLGNSSVAWLIEAAETQCVNCEAEGSDTCNVVVLASTFQWIGGRIFASGGNFPVGIQLGQTAGQTPYSGSINQSGGLTTAVQVSSCRIDTYFEECRAGALDFRNEINNQLIAHHFLTVGSLALKNVPNSQDLVLFTVSGIAPDGTITKSGVYQFYQGLLTTGGALDIQGRALGQAQPRDHSLVAWAFDPAVISNASAGVAGTLYLIGVFVNRSVNVTKIYWGSNAAGSGAVANQNFVGLYNAAGTLLASVGIDADVTAAAGPHTDTITSTALTPGLYWVAILINATVMPTLYRQGNLNANLVNVGIAAAASLRYATAGTALTALPASITPGNNAFAQLTIWAAIG